MHRTISNAIIWPALLSFSALAQAQLSVSINLAPPPLPVYVQPEIPSDGFMWTPGYWAWDGNGNDYFWVPGTWVSAPYQGAMWTPGYWGNNGGAFAWNSGYWSDHIGFYGGINYGHGYTGTGYQGGHWDHGAFSYNRAANNMGSIRVANTYSRQFNASRQDHTSFNGGKGGVMVAPPRDAHAENGHARTNPTDQQVQHETAARGRTELHLATNHGVPQIAATPKAGTFEAPDAVPATNRQITTHSTPHTPAVMRESAPVHPAAVIQPPREPEQAARPPAAAQAAHASEQPPHQEMRHEQPARPAEQATHASEQPPQQEMHHEQPARPAERTPAENEQEHKER